MDRPLAIASVLGGLVLTASIVVAETTLSTASAATESTPQFPLDGRSATQGVSRTVIKDDVKSLTVRVRFEAGVREEPHTHPFDAIVIITAAGTGAVDIDVAGKKTTHVKVGDVLYVPANVTHYVRNTGTQAIEFVTVAVK